jgi:hypothetical protein
VTDEKGPVVDGVVEMVVMPVGMSALKDAEAEVDAEAEGVFCWAARAMALGLVMRRFFSWGLRGWYW